jgi:hypothetical protein
MFIAMEKFIAGLTKVYDKHSSVSKLDGAAVVAVAVHGIHHYKTVGF